MAELRCTVAQWPIDHGGAMPVAGIVPSACANNKVSSSLGLRTTGSCSAETLVMLAHNTDLQ